MTSPDPVKLIQKLGTTLRASSLALTLLYGIGFVYIKTYLAQFGFEVELASLSLPNLLLAHRFFAAQDFFVVAGVLQAWLFLEIELQQVRQRWRQAVIVVLAPWVILGASYVSSVWTESVTPQGFSWTSRYILVFFLGWLVAGLMTYVARNLVKEWDVSFRSAMRLITGALLLVLLVLSYRIYAFESANLRKRQKNFQILEFINKDKPNRRCSLVYVDTKSFFLICDEGPTVIARNDAQELNVKLQK